ncbi:unnamed protein product, partial [Prorocentrum cordatum]
VQTGRPDRGAAEGDRRRQQGRLRHRRLRAAGPARGQRPLPLPVGGGAGQSSHQRADRLLCRGRHIRGLQLRVVDDEQ